MSISRFQRPAALIAAMLTATAVGYIGTGTSVADPARSPGVSDKTTAPATDLGDHPKRPVSTPDPAKWGAPRAEQAVIASSTQADGSVSVTMYTPVKGSSPAVLYRLLKSQGVPGLKDPATPTTPAASERDSTAVTMAGLAACRYGSAQLIRCPTDSDVAHQVHWANGCCTDPQVWFVDHTSSSWPISASTTTWNQSVGIDSSYKYGSCPGYTGQHCVDVTSRNAGCSGWQGQTSWSYYPTNYNLVNVSIELNDYNGLCTVNGVQYDYNKTSYGYRNAACHEMGHALGMGHNSLTGSCLYAQNSNASTNQQPNSDDFTLIGQLYSVAH
ncbi:MAG: matrixin family metalloprotease [Jatrophihabitantaceae bacterium]